MQSIARRYWNKKLLFGVGLGLCLLVVIVVGIYASYRADAERSSTSISVPNEDDMRIDVKIESGLTEPRAETSTSESNDIAAPSDQQPAVTETSPNVEVRVDGAVIDVPEDGSVHKEIHTEDGSTSIDVSTQSSTSSGDPRTRSSINIDVDSSVRIRNETRE